MKNKKAEAEQANQKINQILDGENDGDSFDVDPLIANNNISLVVKEQELENEKS